MLLQATNDSVFSPPTSPTAGDFTVDLVQESTNKKSLGIDIFGGADTVKGPPSVFIKTLSPDGLAACDGRLHAGKNHQDTENAHAFSDLASANEVGEPGRYIL